MSQTPPDQGTQSEETSQQGGDSETLGQLRVAEVGLGTPFEEDEAKLGQPPEILGSGHPRGDATVVCQYPGLEVLMSVVDGSVLSVRATEDWKGPIFGTVMWGDSSSDVQTRLQDLDLGEPVQGDKDPTTLTYVSADGSHAVVLLFNEADELVEAQLTRQVPGNDHQGMQQSA